MWFKNCFLWNGIIKSNTAYLRWYWKAVLCRRAVLCQLYKGMIFNTIRLSYFGSWKKMSEKGLFAKNFLVSAVGFVEILGKNAYNISENRRVLLHQRWVLWRFWQDGRIKIDRMMKKWTEGATAFRFYIIGDQLWIYQKAIFKFWNWRMIFVIHIQIRLIEKFWRKGKEHIIAYCFRHIMIIIYAFPIEVKYHIHIRICLKNRYDHWSIVRDWIIRRS